MHWVTIFSVEDHPPFDLAAAAIGSLFFLLGIALAALRVGPESGSGEWYRRAFGLLFAAFGLGFAVIAVGGGYLQHVSLVSALRTGRDHVVTGVVTNFRPMPANGHGVESFDVAGQHFEYSDSDDRGGFNRSSTFGGPIHAGERVKIAFIKGVILNLQIAR